MAEPELPEFCEVDLVVEGTDEVVEHGVCRVERTADGGVHAHSFRSAANPERDWPLPPGHSFHVRLPAPGSRPPGRRRPGDPGPR